MAPQQPCLIAIQQNLLAAIVVGMSVIKVKVSVDGVHRPEFDLNFSTPRTFEKVKATLIENVGKLKTIKIKGGTPEAFDVSPGDTLANLAEGLVYHCECWLEATGTVLQHDTALFPIFEFLWFFI